MNDKNATTRESGRGLAIGLVVLVFVVVVFAVIASSWSDSGSSPSTSSTPQATADQSSQIQQLQNQIDQLKNRKPQTIVKEVPAQTTAPQNLTIDASEIAQYDTGVNQVQCFGADGSYGTGSLWNISGIGYSVVTNEHVITTKRCWVLVSSYPGGTYELNTDNIKVWNQETDLNILPIVGPWQNDIDSQPISSLNYKIGTLRSCPNDLALGSSVMVIGFPVSGRKSVTLEQYGSSYQWFKIFTPGIISGYDSTVRSPVTGGNLPYSNYFVSNQIDSGNSGGVAISKDSNGLCLLGIPTWVNTGNYSYQGVVQNINNIKYRP